MDMATAAQDADAAPAGYVVLATVDQHFLRMFDLWFRYYAETGIEWPVHVAAIGQMACDAIRARAQRWPLTLHPLKAGHGNVMVRRLRVLKMLLDRGVDVVSTDLDAFWLSKRTPELADRRFDVQMSIAAYGWPPEAVATWGFSLCCGLSIIHSSEATRRLMREWIARSVQDDQRAFNRILMDHGMYWKHPGRANGNKGVCDALGLTVEAIDYRRVTRTPDIRQIDRSRLAVFHPRLSARREEMKVLQSIAGLARLRPRLFLCGIAIEASLRATKRWIVSIMRPWTRPGSA